MLKLITTDLAVSLLKKGDIIAYPTEAVYGLGCDPDNQSALEKLLSLKSRSPSKGLVLIAASIEQLNFYVDFDSLPTEIDLKIKKSWPGFITWLLPVNKKNMSQINPILYGRFHTLAVRVSDHPVVIDLCNAFSKPLVSTSANISGVEAIKDRKLLDKVFNGQIAGIVNGNLGGHDKPSTIINAITEEIIR